MHPEYEYAADYDGIIFECLKEAKNIIIGNINKETEDRNKVFRKFYCLTQNCSFQRKNIVGEFYVF